MNIGIFMHNYLPSIGGAQICAHCLANSLSKMGQRVTVYARKDRVRACADRGWRFRYKLEGIAHIPSRIVTSLPWIGLPAATAVMAARILSDKLDVVQLVVAWPWLPVAKDVGRLTGAPIVVRCAGDDIQIDDALRYGIRRNVKVSKLLERGFVAVDRGIAISATVSEEYQKAGIPASKIAVIPPGVDFEAFRACQIDKNQVRRTWGLPTDKKLIISVGRNHPKKGFRDLIRALPVLNQTEERFVVAVVGKDSDRLLPDANALGVRQSFFPIKQLASMPEGEPGTFPSRELIELYTASDYVVQPSYIETYGKIALEAMAAGIPAIVTDAPGCIDTVVDRVDGLIVPVNAPETIAKRILLLESDEQLRANIIQQGMRKAAKQDWDNIAAEYLRVYEAIQNQR